MRILFLSTAAALLGSPIMATSAQAQAAPTAPAPKPAHDPNEVICQKEEVIGSRLATKRICKTRAEWAEEQRENRMDLDRKQVQRGMNTPQ